MKAPVSCEPKRDCCPPPAIMIEVNGQRFVPRELAAELAAAAELAERYLSDHRGWIVLPGKQALQAYEAAHERLRAALARWREYAV